MKKNKNGLKHLLSRKIDWAIFAVFALDSGSCLLLFFPHVFHFAKHTAL